MTKAVINIAEKFAGFSDLWSPRIIAQMNDYHFKLAKIKGEFTWHSHQKTDEVFIVMGGEMTIHLRDGQVDLHQGEMYVVPKGVEHKPSAEQECHLMVVELAGTPKTGDAGDDPSAPDEIWI